ncbi:MAG: metalloregulator ArsR/SmtB family transcription factor [Litorilinea sp.]
MFKALADHHRRHLLDLLAHNDGQTLNELCDHLPITRIGVMKHLRILEDAGLISTRKVGRTKQHFLNPTPLHLVADWAQHFVRLRSASFDRLEELLHAQHRDQQTKDQSE